MDKTCENCEFWSFQVGQDIGHKVLLWGICGGPTGAPKGQTSQENGCYRWQEKTEKEDKS